MIRKIPFAVMLCTLMVNAPFAYASFDMEDCNWSDDRCLLKGIPVLTPDNDSRDNLLRLLSEVICAARSVHAGGYHPLPGLLFRLSSTVG